MKIEYRRLTEKEITTFIGMRIQQLREEGAKEEINLVPALREYYMRHMADGTFVSWLAWDGENIIGTSGCHLWKNRHILDALVGKWAYCLVCIRIRNIEEWGLQGNYYLVL